MILYRDDSHWCPYCQKVQMLLELKRVPYVISTVLMSCYGAKPAWYLNLMPSGMIPSAELDGRLLRSSDDIIAAVERRFTDIPTMPASGTALSDRAAAALRLEREVFGCWMRWVTSRGKGFAGGLEMAMVRALQRVNDALPDPRESRSAFFLGDAFGPSPSLVDVCFAPFLERMAASLPFFKGFRVRGGGFDRLDRWFAAMEQFEPYAELMGDYYSHAYSLPPQLGGCPLDSDEIARRVAAPPLADGAPPPPPGGHAAWFLPLRRLTPDDPEFYEFMRDEDMGQRRAAAAAALRGNQERVAKFAMRGAAAAGVGAAAARGRRYAPLADPDMAVSTSGAENAATYEAVMAALDVVIRALETNGAQGADDVRAAASRSMENVRGLCSGGEVDAGDVVASLAYLRDRIGVPRDMSFAAARQARAHVSWAIGGMRSS